MRGAALEIALAVVLGVAIVVLVMGLPPARAHDPYTRWMVPGTFISCCSNRDCRPTRARRDEREGWEAWDGARWVKVPDDRVLRFPSPDGRSHLCEANGTIYCFMPGETKS